MARSVPHIGLRTVKTGLAVALALFSPTCAAANGWRKASDRRFPRCARWMKRGICRQKTRSGQPNWGCKARTADVVANYHLDNLLRTWQFLGEFGLTE